MPEGAPSPVTERLLVVTQPHICNAQLAIAAVRAGAIGLLDLGFSEVRSIWQSAITQLARAAEHRHDWGVYWDVFEQQQRFPECLAGLSTERWPVLLLGGLDLDRHSAADILTQARQVADRVLLEVYSPAGALAAQAAGFDGLVLKGHESGGRVSDHCAFVFLQHLRNALRIPYWVRGGVHPQTAPAATLAGATGVVLCEQLWLTRESPLSKDDVQLLARCGGKNGDWHAFHRKLHKLARVACGEKVITTRPTGDSVVCLNCSVPHKKCASPRFLPRHTRIRYPPSNI